MEGAGFEPATHTVFGFSGLNSISVCTPLWSIAHAVQKDKRFSSSFARTGETLEKKQELPEQILENLRPDLLLFHFKTIGLLTRKLHSLLKFLNT